jgi:putative nucleotidyltransferase with HDIG domain
MIASEVRDDLDCLDRLPPLPAVLSRLLGCLGRPDVELEELDDVVRQDPMLAARILRVASSAVYGARVPPRTTRDALLRLGLVEVRRLALALSLAGALPVTRPEAEYRTFWQHSLGVAWTAQEIARRVRGRPPGIGPDELFLAGLFHDIGQLVLVNRYPSFLSAVRRLAAEQAIRQFEAELVVLGTDHGELGARIAAHWRMPDFVVESVRGHHRPDRAWAPFRWHASVIAAADFLYSAHGLGDLGERFRIDLTEDVWEALGLADLGLDLYDSLALSEAVADEASRCAVILAA